MSARGKITTYKSSALFLYFFAFFLNELIVFRHRTVENYNYENDCNG